MTVFKLRIYINLSSLVSLKTPRMHAAMLFMFASFPGKG